MNKYNTLTHKEKTTKKQNEYITTCNNPITTKLTHALNVQVPEPPFKRNPNPIPILINNSLFDIMTVL
jgi:hypothetical protein